MKKLITMMLCITCVAAFSFFKNAQKSIFRKLGTNLYQSQGTVAMSEAHKTNLKAVLMKEYGIKNFNQETTLSFKKVTDAKYPKLTGYSMAERTVGNNIFMQTMVNKALGEPEEVTQSGIYKSSASSASVGEITSILENYKN